MVQKVKDRIINSLIYIASGVSVALIMFFVNNNKAAAEDLQEQLDSKVDKTEFVEFKKENTKDLLTLEEARKEDIEKMTKYFDQRFEDLKDWIEILAKSKKD